MDIPREKIPGNLSEVFQLSGNPDPELFVIKMTEVIGRFVIVEVCYLDCTNYEGNKILVFENVLVATIANLRVLDPHFCTGAHPSPIARFVPTKQGLKYARKFCRALS